jgi:D-lyxose ketol-isomerase
MKRSEINSIIDDALVFFDEMNFYLPPWSGWDPVQWNKQDSNIREIVDAGLGWDLTDFGSGEFFNTGLVLFTLRNGSAAVPGKTYAEKIMVVRENQVTPMHFHWSKMEDIINRGGGNLCIELYLSDQQEGLSGQSFSVSIDGIERRLDPGATVCLGPGQSITLYQGLYHRFYGEPGSGTTLVGEVSAVNDDHSDNRFLKEEGRFPEIEEDTDPKYLLTEDYPRWIR